MSRAVRCACVVVFVMSMWVGVAAAESPFERPVHAVQELVNKRTPESRTWELSSGERVTQIASAPVQWKDSQGDWHDYDLSLQKGAAGWFAQPGETSVVLPAVLDQDGEARVRVASDAGDVVSMAFLGRGAVGGVDDGVMTYRGVAEGVDLRLRPIAEGLKEDVVLNTASASRDLRYRLTTSAGLVLEETRDGGLRAVRGGDTVFEIPAPTLTDDGRGLGLGRFALRQDGERSWILTTVLPEKWLDAPDRKWPVIVDPTVSLFNVGMREQCNRATLYDPSTRRPWTNGPVDFCDTGWAGVAWVGKSSNNINSGWFEYWEWALEFDTALTLVPTDAIDSATLKLYRSANSATPPIATDVRRASVPWTPLPASYVDPVPYAQIPPSAVGPVTADITAIVDSWRRYERNRATGFPNYGIQLSQAFVNPYTGPTPYSCANEPCPRTDFYAQGWSDPARRPMIEVRSWPAAAAGNAIISPGEGDLTGKRVRLQARALASSVRTVRFQYIAGSQRRWTDIPLAALSTPTRVAASSVDIPVTGTSGDRRSDLVMWDLSAMPGGDVDGPVHVRAWLESSIAGDGGMTDEVNFRLDRRGIDKAPSVDVGPGELNLLSGEFALEQTDASVRAFLQDLQLTRTYRSRGVSVRNADMFGSGWEASVEADGGALPYKGMYNYSEVREVVVDRQYLDPSAWNWEQFFQTFSIEDLDPDIETMQETERFNVEYAVVEASDGTKMTFTAVDGCSGGGTNCWTSDDLHPGFTLSRVSTGTTGVFEFTLTDPGGNVAKFQSEAANSPSYRLQSFEQPGSGTALSYAYEASGTRQRLKRVTAPYPTGGVPRSLTFTWSNVGTPAVPRVTSVAFSDGHATTTTVASYSYDANARLTQVTDPRIAGSARNVRYHYNAGGQLDQITPSGEATWNLAYTTIRGDTGPRLASVSRAHPDGGTATRTIRYDVPLSGAGAPYDLSAATTARWGQDDDLPWDGVAIWPEDTVPDPRSPDYSRASIHYLGAQGLEVNVAKPGGAISTDWHDARGNVIRILSPQGRAVALAAGASSAAVAADRSTLFQFASNGVDLVATREPVTLITLSDGRTVRGRRITTTYYDEGAPAGGPFHLPTRKLRAVETSSGDFDIRELVRYSYAGEGGMSGWIARQATKTIVDPANKALTSYSILNGSYPIVEETRTAGSPSGGSNADVQWYQYFGTPTTRVPAGIGGANSNCSTSRGPQYPTGFLCLRTDSNTGAAAQVPRRFYTYMPFGHVATVVETRTLNQSGATDRRTTRGYDSTDQLTSLSVTGGTGTAVPTVSYTYDPATGQQLTATSTAGTVRRAFDSNGRLSQYTDTAGTVTTSRYDLRGRQTSKTVDGAMTSLGYDNRDNLTSVNDPAVGSAITGSYDLDDNLASETLPNGLVMTETYDETSRPMLLRWEKTSGCSSNCTWARSEVNARDADGRIIVQRTNATQETLAYDTVGRLAQSDAVRLSDNRCVRRTYAFDGGSSGDSNRTSSSVWTSSPGAACGTGSPTTRTLTYDTADRITSAGWTWDDFGRATAVPAADSGGTGGLTAGYFTNDRVRQLTLDGRTHTYGRDPLDRTRSIDSTGASKPTLTTINRYSDDSDEPEKITVSTGAIVHDIEGPSGQIVATNVNGSLSYNLRDLQGSIVATAPAAGTPNASTEYDPYGIVTTAAPNVIDWTYGDPGWGWLGAHQRATQFGQTGVGAAGAIEMGARVYLPKVGRFLQVDPIDASAANAYDYVWQDPANDLDLSGLKSCTQYWRDYARDHSSPIPLNCNAGHPGPVSIKSFVNTLRFVYHVGSCAVRLVKSRGVDASACNQF